MEEHLESSLRDPMEETDLLLLPQGATSSPSTSPRSTKDWQSNFICRLAFVSTAWRDRSSSRVSWQRAWAI